MEDILLVDKPKGMSSFDVIRQLRKKLGIRKMGHAGTLDPMATGLLIIGVGKGTRRLSEFIGLPKTYRMGILMGMRSRTGDLEGEIIETVPVEKLERPDVERVFAGLVGEIILPIPAYSAVKYQGRPRYSYARSGIAIPEKIRKTKIYRLDFLGMRREGAGVMIEAELEAEKGTYARAVAEEVGRRLGLPATLAGLRRTKIGNYDVRQAKTLPELGS